MRSEKILITLLKKFVEVVSEEYNQNPDFAERIDQVLADSILGQNGNKKKKQIERSATPISDLYNEWHSRDEPDFSLWLLEHPVPVLQATIRSYELDARKQATKWKDPKKLTDFITERLRTKVTRGSSFIRTGEGVQHENKEGNG